MYFKYMYHNISNLNLINFADKTLNIIYLGNKWTIGCVKIMPNAKVSKSNHNC